MGEKMCLAISICKFLVTDWFPFKYNFIISWNGNHISKSKNKNSKIFKLQKFIPLFLAFFGFAISSLPLIFKISLDKETSGLHYSLNLDNKIMTKSKFINIYYGSSLCFLFVAGFEGILYYTAFIKNLDDIILGCNAIMKFSNEMRAYKGINYCYTFNF